jgi:hypothetical protein
MTETVDRLAMAAEADGLMVLGGLVAASGPIPSAPDGTRTLVLIGWGGGGNWQTFQASPEFVDGLPDPLDRWTKRVVDPIAGPFNARPLYPSEGPPWYPFQACALAAGIAYRSPIGLLIHPRYGLWHSYRAALALPDELALEPVTPEASPCDSCSDRPCLSACPIGAYRADGFDVQACRAHVGAESGVACRDDGCFSRNACPVGVEWHNSSDQIRFHQRAFLASAIASA